MRHDDRRKPHLAHQPAQQVQKPRLHADIQPAGRFVHEHQPRPGHQVARDLQPLLHAARKGRRAVVDPVGGDLDPAQPVGRRVADRAVVPRAHGHQPLAHIAAGGDPHPQPVARVLVHEGPVGARQPAPLGLGHRAACRAGRRRCRRSPRPGSGGRCPARQDSSVDLPDPLSPTIPSTSPGKRSKRHIRAADPRAIALGQPAHRQQRRSGFTGKCPAPSRPSRRLLAVPGGPACPASRRPRQKSVSEQTNIRLPWSSVITSSR